MWYILIEFISGPAARGYQAVDGSGVTQGLVDLNGTPIPDDGKLEYRVIDATPPRPAWAALPPNVNAATWEPRDV